MKEIEKENTMERACLYRLIRADGMGLKHYRRWQELGLSAKEFWESTEEQNEKYLTQMQAADGLRRNLSECRKNYAENTILQEYEALQNEKIRFTIYGEADYPKRLYDIPNPPLALYYKGTLPKEESLNVAIIGARQCSQYGSYVATELAKELADAGITLISGMARGIDGISQEAAAQRNGSVYAVLGSGVDVCYPRSNAGLYENLCRKEGCGVLSEYAPGTAARASLFPPRNRIISGLSDVVVVVEACLRSGTLITVDMALEQGKEVYAVPGRVTDRLSDGCNKLIREGAVPFWSPAEFIQEILEKKDSLVYDRHLEAAKSTKEPLPVRKKTVIPAKNKERSDTHLLSEPKPPAELTETEKSVYAQCDLMPKSADTILSALPQMNMPEVLRALTMLELKGCIMRVGGEYRKTT